MAVAGYGEWNETLCGCFDDTQSCMYGYYFPAGLFADNAEKIDGSNWWSMCALYCALSSVFLNGIPHYMKRQILRQKYGLREDPCNDCPVTFFCSPLALCQEARFLKRIQMASGGIVIVQQVVPGQVIVNQPRTNH